MHMDVKMSRFVALRGEYALPVNVKAGRIEILRAAAQGIYDNLIQYLELPIWSFTDIDGQQMPYVSVGSIEGEQFRLRNVSDFVAGAHGLSFAINIVFDEAVDQFPKAFILFMLTVDEQNDVLTVTSHSTTKGPVVFTGSDFTPISAHIHEILCTELLIFKGLPTPVELTS